MEGNTMIESAEKTKQYKFGMSRFGNVPAMRVAVPIGIALGCVACLLQVYFLYSDSANAWSKAFLLAVFETPFFVLLAFICVVDRTTIPGAIPNPEITVENTWYNKAALDAFHTVLAGGGMALFALSFFRSVPSAVTSTLLVVLAIMILSFMISYAISKYRR